jgi:hypothetical protein
MAILTDFLDAPDPFCDRGNQASSLAQKLRQLGNIGRDPPRLIARETSPLVTGLV